MINLNITNGMAMLKYFDENNINLEGETLPFNEAMCEGEATPDIFGAEFIDKRSSMLGEGIEEYEEIVINPLSTFFTLDYDRITLFFDEDCFCQINLITILGYLDKNEYDGEIILNIVDKYFVPIRTVKIFCAGFYAVYLEVLVCKRLPNCVLPDVMLDGILAYLELSKDDNEIDKFILENISMPDEELLTILFDNFERYGLGDTQYLNRISKIKGI